ncbi:hypothetical protein GCM10007205_19570 [Oxalicibacterium flavum]|uniref:Secreted protein n=1 Tax=Oxalicibacterium flavum TaxID=179467 RepID=A0A8J2UPT7_9BURK|nr:hypothetical protein [Oxalicibacterium flavum]GGC10539.1 hypothetical protein GCM10007205_19570 [Oxalicibacterium flavum]
MGKSLFVAFTLAMTLSACGSDTQAPDTPLTAEEEAAKAERIRKANAAAESQLGH